MDYFEERIQRALKDDSVINFDKKRAIPAIYRLSSSLKDRLADYSKVGDDLSILFFRSRDKRNVVVFRFRDADAYLVLKHFSKNQERVKRQPVQVLAMKGREALLVLKLIARQIHEFFDDLDAYCDAIYPDIHINYIFDTNLMTGALGYDDILSEVEREFDGNGEKIF